MGSGKLSYEYAKKLGASDIYDYDGTAVFKYKIEAMTVSLELLKELNQAGKNKYANTTVKKTSCPHGPGFEIYFFK